jgi:exosome complex exonuclease RRP6
MVNTILELEKMVENVLSLVKQNGFTEIALDLEHNHERSYLGITCLIQLTTR